jgi:nucleotide-binding universal stress UspA family protein
MSGILVGVDGSDHSRHALSWAMREAAHHHVPLTVMMVQPPPVRPATQICWNLPNLPDRSFAPEIARMALQKMVDEVVEGHRLGEQQGHAVRGQPGRGHSGGWLGRMAEGRALAAGVGAATAGRS